MRAAWELWLSTVTDARRLDAGEQAGGQARQPVSFRLVMAVLARFADHDTGRNARPSLRRLQALTNLSHPTVRKALVTAEQLGFIKASGSWTPPNGGRPVTVWALGYPTPAGFVGWDAPANDAATPHHWLRSNDAAAPEHCNDAAPPQHRQDSNDAAAPQHWAEGAMMRPHRTIDDAAARHFNDAAAPHMTSSTSRPQGSEGDERTAHAAAPEGAPRSPQADDLAREVIEALRQRWNGQTPALSNRSRQRLAALLERGWTHDAVLAGVATIGRKPKNPVLLLEAHLKRLLEDHQPDDFTPLPAQPEPTVIAATPMPPPVDQALAVWRGEGLQGDDLCPHGIRIREGTSWCADCQWTEAGAC